MTRSELRQLYILKKELKTWEDKLRKMESKMGASAIAAEATGVHSTSISDKTGNLASDIADVKEIIQHLVCMISRKIVATELHIASVDDPRLRQILEYRFVRGYTWVKVGIALDMPDTTAKSIFYNAYPE